MEIRRKYVWYIESTKCQPRRVVLSSISDDNSELKGVMYIEFASYSRGDKLHLMKETFNNVTLLKQLDRILGINRCIFHIGTVCTYFLYHIEEEDLASLSYLCQDASKVWYDTASNYLPDFGNIVAEYVYAPDFVNDFEGGARQILHMKTTFFDPSFLMDKDSSFKIVHVLLPKGHFVVVPRSENHGELKSGYKVPKVNNFADYSWIEAGHVPMRVNAGHLPWNPFVSLLKYILQQEALRVIPLTKRHSHVYLPLFVTTLAEELTLALEIMFDNAESKLNYSSCHDCGTVMILALLSSVPKMEQWFSCKRVEYSFLKVYEYSDSTFTTLAWSTWRMQVQFPTSLWRGCGFSKIFCRVTKK